MEKLVKIIEKKRKLANKYNNFFISKGIGHISKPEYAKSNYWLNTIILDNKKERDQFLQESNQQGIMTRPAWEFINRLPMYKHYQLEI